MRYTVMCSGWAVTREAASRLAEEVTAWLGEGADDRVEIWAPFWSQISLGLVTVTALLGNPMAAPTPACLGAIDSLRRCPARVSVRYAVRNVRQSAELQAIAHGWPIYYI